MRQNTLQICHTISPRGAVSEQPEYEHDVFISYADADAAWVEGYLLDALEMAGVRYHSEEAFRLGAPRLIEFERAVENSKRALLIITPTYLSENSAQFVNALAQNYGLETATWPVIPLILQSTQLPPRLAMLKSLDATAPDKWEQVIERLCDDLKLPPPAPPPKPPCPYPGMAPFGEADSARFYGRDQEIEELVQRLRLHPFVAVIGPSGSGKSSLVYAGLVPALRKSGFFGTSQEEGTGWLVRAMRPGEKPLAALTDVLDGDPSHPDQVISDLLATTPDADKLLLLVDQFEETFTTSKRDAEAFQRILGELLTTANCYVVLTVRADFYAELMSCPLWNQIQARRFEVLPMDESNMRQAIVMPAEDVGVFVESTLVERLVADGGGEPGTLPLVQETLVLLWEHVKRRFMPLSAYEALVLARDEYDQGDVSGLQVAMARRANNTLAELSPEDQSTARRIILRLIQFGDGRADTRRQQPVTALRSAGEDPKQFDRVLRHLVDNRLLTMGGEESAEGRKTDIAHEALISGWPTLRAWLDERREAEQIRRRLEGKAAEWDRLGRSSGGLLDDVELLEAERWIESPDAADLGHSDDLLALIEASRAAIEEAEHLREEARQRELEQTRALAEEQRQRAEEQTRSAVRLRRVLSGLAVMFVIAAIAAVLALVQQSAAVENRIEAERASTRAVEQQTTAEAASTHAIEQQMVAEVASTRAVEQQVAAEAASTLAVANEQEAVTERNAAATAEVIAKEERDKAQEQHRIALSRQLAAQALNHLDTQLDLALLLSLQANRIGDSPEIRGSLLAALLPNPHLITYLHAHTDDIRGVAFSPDGRVLATAGADSVIYMWDTETHRQIGKLDGHSDAVKSVAFGPDGKTLASGSDDRTIILWDVQARQPQGLALVGHEGNVNCVVFSPDGKTLASASSDNTVRLWDVETKQSTALAGHEDLALSVAFSPDGKTLASVSSDNTIRLWDVEAGNPIGDPLVGHTRSVLSVAFSPDGQTLASGSRDMTIRLWDVVSRQPLGHVLTAHTDRVASVAFSPDGSILASGSWDNSLILWDTRTWEQIGEPLKGHTNLVQSVAFGPDGQMLASGANDDIAILWDIQGRQSLGQTIVRHGSELVSVAHSPVSGMLALGTADSAVLLLDMSSGEPVSYTLRGHTEGWVNDVAFSPDGQTLASAGDDDRIILWDVESRQQRGEPIVGHTDDVLSIAFSPDGSILASGSADATVILWNVETGEPLGLSLKSHEDWITDVEFSPDGSTLASCGWDETIVLWDIASREPLFDPLTLHTSEVYDVAFSPDGRIMASASGDASIILWDTRSGKPVGDPLEGHTNSVMAVVFHPDGEILASAGEDNAVILWHLPTKKRIGPPMSLHTQEVRGITFALNDQALASVSQDGTCILWDIQFESWVSRACRKANRNLKDAEWETFTGSSIERELSCPDLADGK
jgi:WD40 repeat protein